jgi:hypothetical protein
MQPAEALFKWRRQHLLLADSLCRARGAPFPFHLVGRLAEADLIAVYGLNEVQGDVVVEATRFRIILRQLDLASVDVIDGADVPAVRTDDGRMFPDLIGVYHVSSPFPCGLNEASEVMFR